MNVLTIIPLLVAVVHSRPEPPSPSYLPVSDQSAPTAWENGVYGYGGGYQASQGEKHVYFFASGEQPEYSRFRIYVEPSSRKNTKIIFVKAPSHGGVIPEVIAPPSLAEDKTLVYVLVKKPEDGSVTIPAGVGVKQTKPEVFFIKYNNKHDAKAQVNLGVEGQRVGVKVPDLANENVFISTLGSGAEHSSEVGGGYQSFVSHSQNGNDGISAQGGVSGGNDKHGPTGASGPY
ncbi:hypothetical protein PPYR_11250 [Photinus pyralis]|uniref:DUF243 domain-containing protein n=1 Tax=Photinus pyralis TaxID=7054 RepID=A0A5N4AAS6_PHOPY|nr:uncharacterized protein LOC116175482 [Photinus pyralis]KAB0794411.1 hypothetical protein PPYR_11250 [Photinus pyralis]